MGFVGQPFHASKDAIIIFPSFFFGAEAILAVVAIDPRFMIVAHLDISGMSFWDDRGLSG